MRIKASGLRAAPLCLIVMLLAFGGLSCTVQAQAPADDHSPAELKRQIDELYREGKFREAIPLAEKVVFLTKRAKGEEHPDTATSLNDLAELYEAVGDYTKAEPLYQKALAIRQKVLGPDHPDTGTSLNNLAGFYLAVSDYAKAEPLYQNALAIRQKVLGPDHPNTATSLENLAVLSLTWDETRKPKSTPTALRTHSATCSQECSPSALSLSAWCIWPRSIRTPFLPSCPAARQSWR
ncbi:MAG TPA: tetratricopeptide repeat protein [Chthoniobacterales bacterium]|nr:tetratricopeptide repeat protein [Chthoniobacterales bacterium]